ncbi:MAG TPA: hypothetical protein VGE74_10350 [Gemmata sp.]
MRSQILAVAGVLFVTAFTQAVPPPGTYDKLRAGAEEAVTIQVVTVVSGANGDVGVQAKVLGVERSKSGLKKGDTVSIKYTVPAKGTVGPTPVPVLEKDEVYPAFLNKKGDEFAPAAYGSSFKMTPEAVAAGPKAEKFGNAVLKVEELMALDVADPKMAKVREDVIGIGQGGDEMYRWVQSRLFDQVSLLKSWIRDTRPGPDEVKKARAKIEFLLQVTIEIDAPK